MATTLPPTTAPVAAVDPCDIRNQLDREIFRRAQSGKGGVTETSEAEGSKTVWGNVTTKELKENREYYAGLCAAQSGAGGSTDDGTVDATTATRGAFFAGC